MTSQQETYCSIINSIHTLASKFNSPEQERMLKRRMDKIASDFEQLGIKFSNPIGEEYNETRSDCEASIASDNLDQLIISEVIKPIVYARHEDGYRLIQRAVVIVK